MPAESLVTVRRASVADAESLSVIGSSAFSAAYADFNQPQDLSAHLREQYSPTAILRETELPDRFYLIALANDEPAGLCKLRAGPSPEGIPNPASLEIQQLYIDPRHQRRGIGKALVDAVVSEARSLQLADIWLGVWEQATWAIDFYWKYGFTEFGRQPFRLGSTRQTDLLMWISASDD